MTTILKNTIFKKIGWLLLIGFLTYFSSLWNQFVWDDEQFIYNNTYVKTFSIREIFTESTTSGAGNISSYYRPLTTLSFAWDHQFWSLNPFGFHLTNTLFHLAAGILLFLYLKELGLSEKWSWVTAVFFIIHPMQTEAVVYANSRGDSLYAFFTLLGLYCFALSFKSKILSWTLYQKQFVFSKTKMLAVALIAYALAILSKEIGLAGLGLFALTWLKQTVFSKTLILKEIKTKIKKYQAQLTTWLGMAATAGYYLYLRMTRLNFGNGFEFYDPNHPYSQSIWVRLMTFMNSLWTYWRLLITPFPLHMERTTPVILSPINWRLFLLAALFILLVVIGYREIRKNKSSWIWFGTIWFLTMMVPVSGIIPINGLFYEHWMYLPMIGFFLVVTTMGKMVFNRLVKSLKINQAKSKKILFVLGITLASFYIVLTIRQNFFWSTPIRFYTYTLQYAQSARLRNNLGMAYADDGQYKKAIDQYQRSLEMNPYYPQTYHNLGNAYLSINNLEQAEENYRQALQVDPNFYYSYQPLIQIYLSTGQPQKAIPLLNKQLETNPDNWQLLVQHGQALYQSGQRQQAELSFTKALEVSNNHQQVKLFISNIKQQTE